MVQISEQSAGFGTASMPAPSPDGRSIVFRGNGPDDGAMLWIRPLKRFSKSSSTQ